MTLNMLRYFISVAEKGSFTEAAAACFVSQPALSRAIANLEGEIGCALINRDSHKSVELTPAGEVMLVEARRVMQQIDVLAERVRRAEQENRCGITIGYIAYGLLNRFRCAARVVIEALAEAGASLEPVYGAAQEIRERLLSGELDCAILPESCTWDLQSFRRRVVCSSEFQVLVPKNHPLFGEQTIRIEQLRDSGFVFFDPKDLPETLAMHTRLCLDAGFSPRAVAYGRKIGDIVHLACQYGAVGFVSDAFTYAATDEVRLIPLENRKERLDLVFVCAREPVNPMTSRLFEALEEEESR